MSCSCGQTDPQTGICPCTLFVHPRPIFNSPGLSTIEYRIGDFTSFRHALLLSRPGENELANWRPGAQGDLAVQMVEWWAYLSDILTFYNERIANQAYLRTATLPESVRRMIAILGYRPRPGIGATATIAATLTGIKPVTLPAGYPAQSKPGPGQEPQTFELDAATVVQPPDKVSADPVPSPALLSTDGLSVLVQGAGNGVKAGDRLLLMASAWPSSGSYATVTVQSTTEEKDPRGKSNTRITFTASVPLSSELASAYRLLRSRQSARPWQYSSTTVIEATKIDLDSIQRSIKPNDPVLFTLANASPVRQLVSIQLYSEIVWYANPAGNNPLNPPTGEHDIPVPIPHSHLEFSPSLTSFADTPADRQSALVEFDWADVGTVLATPSTSLDSTQLTLTSPLPASILPLSARPVLIADAAGSGVRADVSASSSSPSTLGLSNLSDPEAVLTAPLNVFFNLLAVSRGKTVSNEILGSGNATVAGGQEFKLKKSPLTYLMDTGSSAGYRSTLKVWVDGVQWKEVASFYGQPSNARVFVTREDDDNVTHVQFGDGENGARVPSGVNNVVATYRYGSGAASPDTGALSVILQPFPGLKALVNPVAAGGGADPDPREQIQRYAPQSVTTFGRAISAADYTTIAAQAPGVARARSYFSWDAVQGRTMIKVYVGDDTSAVANANIAIAAASDPNRPFQVRQATGVPVSLSFTLVVDPLYQAESVKTDVAAALVDPDAGLFGANVVRIGQSVWRSRIEKACLTVAGAVAVHNLRFGPPPQLSQLTRSRFVPLYRRRPTLRPTPSSAGRFANVRFDPGEGGFFQLAATSLSITTEVAANAG